MAQVNAAAQSTAFGGVFAGTRVLVTGDTGFKGAWLCRWLHRLGAEVTGLALPPDTAPSLHVIARVAHHTNHHDVDIRDAAAVAAVIGEARPEVIIHMAAQPLVRRSYRAPLDTFAVNVMGTAHVLEAARGQSSVRATLVVTTDKVYEHRGDGRPHKESDALGGHDPYSASKAAAELVVASYRRSYFQPAGCPLVVARAGNVIGGGDFAEDRIVPDVFRALVAGQPVELRNPSAVRPWQHVLDALSGYLRLLEVALSAPAALPAALPECAFNFGPDDGATIDVGTLAQRFCHELGRGEVVHRPQAQAPHEAQELRLDVGLARRALLWQPVWSTDMAIAETARFYRVFLDEGPEAAAALLEQQLSEYESAAARRGLAWARGAP